MNRKVVAVPNEEIGALIKLSSEAESGTRILALDCGIMDFRLAMLAYLTGDFTEVATRFKMFAGGIRTAYEVHTRPGAYCHLGLPTGGCEPEENETAIRKAAVLYSHVAQMLNADSRFRKAARELEALELS
jgi:hypothetical protein